MRHAEWRGDNLTEMDRDFMMDHPWASGKPTRAVVSLAPGMSTCSNKGLFHPKHVQYSRIEHVCNVCRHFQTGMIGVADKYRNISTNVSLIMSFTSLGVNYCKVPKIGCTFMSQIFKILTDKAADITSIFSMSRSSVHSLLKEHFISKQNKSTEDPSIRSMPTILMARNPYSRLYSAYVDKMFLPSLNEDRGALRQFLFGDDGLCGETPSFKQFLRYVIHTVHTNKNVNEHWAPINTICKPCLRNNIIIIKQESFSDDVESLLDYLSVTDQTRKSISDAMTIHRVESSVPGIIKVTMQRVEKLFSDCFTKLEAVKMLWKSFQIQGYIFANKTFPALAIQTNKKISIKTAVNIIMAEIKQHSLSSLERDKQRWRYLVEAFEDIPVAIVREIRHIYKADFLLFDYDSTPPS